MTGAEDASLLMGTAQIGIEFGVEDLESARKFTDEALVKEEGRRVKQLRPPRQIDNLGGLPGWLYIYSFQDPDTKQQGAHAHYFLFQGKTMITLVFQTLPSERFATYAPLFDRLANTFKAGAAG